MATPAPASSDPWVGRASALVVGVALGAACGSATTDLTQHSGGNAGSGSRAAGGSGGTGSSPSGGSGGGAATAGIGGGAKTGGTGGVDASGGTTSGGANTGGAGGAGGIGASGTGSSGGTGGAGGSASKLCNHPPANCSCETFDDHEYMFCAVNATWNVAETSCLAIGMDLVAVGGVTEERWLYETAVAHGMPGDLWSGGRDVGAVGSADLEWQNGVHFWSGAANGTPVNDVYSHFRPGEPNGSGRCVVLQSDHLWDDQDCTWSRNYICEGPGGSNAATPYDCTMTPPLGCECHTIGSESYLFCSVPLGFQTARVGCLSAGMHLVRLNDTKEDQAVRAQADALAFGSYFADGNDLAVIGDWRWSDPAQTLFWSNGAQVGGAYVNWATGEPNASGDCLVVDSGPGWDDTDCVSHSYVCEGQ